MTRRLAQLRGWFHAGLALAVLSAPTFLEISLPVPALLGVLCLLAVFNFISIWRSAHQQSGTSRLVMQLCIDLVGLGVLLYLSGGAANPLVSLLLFPVAVAALCLPGRWVIAVTVLAVGIYSFLMGFFLPLAIADIERASRLHIIGMWLTFVVSAVMAAWFITRMTASIRARDAQLADVREQALRDAQVVALGQLAAGAAHELGTPLATMTVLAGELAQEQRLPADLRVDVDLLRQQIVACKNIIGGLATRAGIERAGSVQRMSATDWLSGVLVHWRCLWPQASCHLVVDGADIVPQIGVEATLEQAVVNLLNNAARVAPENMCLVLSWDEAGVKIAVRDQGPGFPQSVVLCGGAEPLSGATQGNGIGLWLTRTAVERFGGHLQLENLPTGGVATLWLPRLRAG
jgi:two-component system sensor histidine kinase RegB